jgi:hypothetical protein
VSLWFETYDFSLGLLTALCVSLSRRLTTPLVVLSKPNIIAASVYILAISMMKEQSVYDSLQSLDVNRWQEAFLPQDGIKPSVKTQGFFKRDIQGE